MYVMDGCTTRDARNAMPHGPRPFSAAGPKAEGWRRTRVMSGVGSSQYPWIQPLIVDPTAQHSKSASPAAVWFISSDRRLFILLFFSLELRHWSIDGLAPVNQVCSYPIPSNKYMAGCTVDAITLIVCSREPLPTAATASRRMRLVFFAHFFPLSNEVIMTSM